MEIIKKKKGNLQRDLVKGVLELEVKSISDVAAVRNFLLCDVSNTLPFSDAGTVLPNLGNQ